MTEVTVIGEMSVCTMGARVQDPTTGLEITNTLQQPALDTVIEILKHAKQSHALFLSEACFMSLYCYTDLRHVSQMMFGKMI